MLCGAMDRHDPDLVPAPIRILAAGAPDRLRPGGALVLEIGADQGRAVDVVLRRAGLVDVEIRSDLSGRDRIAIARRPTRRLDVS